MNHVAAVHDDQAVVCDLCGLSVVNQFLLMKHKRVDHNSKVYDCPRCEYKTPSKRSYYCKLSFLV